MTAKIFRHCYLMIVACCLMYIPVLSQGTTAVSIEVADDAQRPFKNLEVVLRETSTLEEMKKRTDATGKVAFQLNSGEYWSVYIDGYRYDKLDISVTENSQSTLSFFVTHDPALNERLKKQTFLRAALQLQTIDQSKLTRFERLAGTFNLEIEVTNSAGIEQASKPVEIICIKQQRKYVSVTDAKGVARFQLPVSNEYDIDIAEQLNASFIDKDAREGSTFIKPIVYDTYNMVETMQGDTILQAIQLPLEIKNSRAPVKVTMQHQDGKPFIKEPVYLDGIINGKVYKALTGDAGTAVFILPFGEKYMIQFNFQKDVDVIDLSEARGKAEADYSITYRPNPALEFPEQFIPIPSELMLTDFNHYHKTPYPTPANISQPGIYPRWGNPVLSPNTKELVLEAGISALHIPAGSRLPINVSFVLDRSGSMAGYERIESLKEGLEKMIGNLQPGDRISIILYDDAMEFLLPSTSIGNNKKMIIDLIRSIKPQGGTDMLKALVAAYEEVSKYYSANKVNSVVLLTDGFDNNPVEVLMKAQEPYNAKIGCTSIGVGKDYNYDLVSQLAGKGKGVLHFAAEGKELVDLFAKTMLSLASPVARNVKIEMDFDPSLKFTTAYGLKHIIIKGNRLTASLPDLYRGMELPVLIHFLVNKIVAANSKVKMRLTYLNPSTNQAEVSVAEISLTTGISGSHPKDLVIDEAQKKMYAIAFANEQLIKMATNFSNGEAVNAQSDLKTGIAGMIRLYPKTPDKDIRELLSKMKMYQSAFENIIKKKKIAVANE